MKTPDEQLLGRWLDGELSPDERASFEAMLDADPALREEAETMKRLGDALRTHVSFEKEVPHADFFNAQVQEGIAAEQRAEERARAGVRSTSSWFDWLRSPWMLTGAAAALAVGFFLLQQSEQAAPTRTQILSAYVPNENVTSKSYYDESAGATVLMLDGLKPIPAERNVAGLNIHHSENDPERAITTLYDERGEVLLVVSKDAANRPQVVSQSAMAAR